MYNCKWILDLTELILDSPSDWTIDFATEMDVRLRK